MTDTPENKDASFSTSDIFKESKVDDADARLKEQLAKYSGEGYVRKEIEDVTADLDAICDRMTKLAQHRRNRHQIEDWDNLFFELKETGFERSAYFSKRLHRELLREFGYKDKYLRRPKPLKNPPIRPGVIAFIFDKMDWAGQAVSKKTYQQRQWIEIRAGLREPYVRERKAKKNNGCLIWAIFIIILIMMVT